LKQLAVVTESAFAIAEYCIKLADFASYVFDHAFKKVRGDSAVALHGAVAAAGGCLAIIELNLLDFEWDDWSMELRAELKKLKADYKNMLRKTEQCLKVLENENLVSHRRSFDAAVADLQSGRWEDIGLSEKGIEKLAQQIQKTLWQYRDLIWVDETPGTYLDVLKPEIAIQKLLGYKFGSTSLGRHVTDTGEFQIAGQIHKQQKIVLISEDLRQDVANFTMAHELGHALLHTETGLHRDRPLDGSTPYNQDIRERQANKFATFFLMPADQVRVAFQQRFLMEKFTVNNDTIFFLGEGSDSDFMHKVKDRRRLALFLATAERFRGQPFRPLAEMFNVSPGAMAIRLLELDVLE
jgi:hypothetical protein